MVYMQMLFALTFDKLVWGTTPGPSLILGPAIYVAMHREDPKKPTERERSDGDEERGLMMADMETGDDTTTSIPIESSRT
jgi:hypothetical protein